MSRLQRGLLGFAAAVLLLHVAGAFLGGPRTWGFHLYAFLPKTLLLVFAGFAALSFVPAVRRALVAVLTPLARALETPAARVLAGAFLALLLGAFWVGRERVFLLSDGRLLIRSVTTGLVSFTADTLSAVIQLYFHDAFTTLFRVDSQTASFRVISFGCGLVWFAAMFAAVGRVTRVGWERLLLGGLLVFLGSTKLFYGYVETGPLLAASVAVYFWTAIRFLTDRKAILPVALAFLLPAAMHVTGLLLFPSFAFLLFLWAGRDRKRLATGLALILVPVVGYLTFWFARGGTVTSIQAAYAPYFAKFVPLVGPLSSKQPYAQLSLERWIDFFNEQFLLGPFALLALPVVLGAIGRSRFLSDADGRGALRRFLLWALVPFLLLAITFLRELGGARDWDLLATLALPAVLLVGLALLEDREGARALPGVAVTLLAVGLLHQFGWVAVDARVGSSLERFHSLFQEGAPVSRFARSYALEELANDRLDFGDPRSAVPYFEEAARVDPANSKAVGSLGALYLSMGQPERALPFFREAVRLRGDVALNHYNLGGALASSGKLDSAAAAYRQAIRLNGRFLQAYQNLGLLLVGMNDRVGADSVWNEALRLFPDTADLYNNLATNQETLGRRDLARANYEKALKLDVDNVDALFNLGRLLLTEHLPEEAVIRLERVTRLVPQNGEAAVNLGLAYEQLNRVEEAMQAYGRAVAVSPKLAQAYLNLARLMVQRGNEEGAIQVLETFMENDPDNARKLGVDRFLARPGRDGTDSSGVGRTR